MKHSTFFILWILVVSCSQAPDPLVSPEPFDIADGTRFIVLGDWGRRGSMGQKAVAEAMMYIAQISEVEFIISTGDNFYNRGVKNVNDSHWHESFESVYSDPALHVPWYISLGNHDHYGNVEAQVEYSTKSDRWVFPARFYSEKIKIHDKGSVQLFVCDTQPMKKKQVGANNQYAWLDETLADHNSDWTFVVGHHPIRTGGKHGESKNIIQNLKPIIDKHNVDIYYAGHDHDLQLLKDKNTHYVVSGSGSKIRRVKNTPYSLFSNSSLGFVLGSISKNELFLYFIDEQAQLLYKHSIKK